MYGEKGIRCNLTLPQETVEELERMTSFLKVSRGAVVSMAVARMFVDEKPRLLKASRGGGRRRRHNGATKDPTEG